MGRMKQIEIAGRPIGEGHPCFIIAEAGVNHNGDIDLAKRLVDVAADANADAVKFQTFKTDHLVARDAPKAVYQEETTGSDKSHMEMLRELELPTESFVELQRHAARREIVFISSPFDHDSVDFLDALDVPAFKVPSPETVNLPLLRHIANKGRPIILSTGMSYLGEVERAVNAIHDAGNDQLVLLHCVSAYPTQPRDVNLRAMRTMGQAFQVPVGFSDHTQGLEVPLAAAALGARVLEKHFTLDRGMAGPDHRASLEPDELARLVAGVRDVQESLGDGIKRPTEAELNVKYVARRSIYVRNSIDAGTPIREDDLICLRPSGGIPPTQFDEVVGKRPRRSLHTGEALAWSDLD